MSGTKPTTGSVVVTLSDGSKYSGNLALDSGASPPPAPPPPVPPPSPPPANVPGAPADLKAVAQAANSISLQASPPTSGGPLDWGSWVVRWRKTGDSTWNTSPPSPYCSLQQGSITDAFGNVWTIAPTGTYNNQT